MRVMADCSTLVFAATWVVRSSSALMMNVPSWVRSSLTCASRRRMASSFSCSSLSNMGPIMPRGGRPLNPSGNLPGPIRLFQVATHRLVHFIRPLHFQVAELDHVVLGMTAVVRVSAATCFPAEAFGGRHRLGNFVGGGKSVVLG